MLARLGHHVATELDRLMLDSFRATGPLSFATFMQLSLSHPVHGYYMNPSHHVFGARGDFVTSPEISQTFGDVLALWSIAQWSSAGSKPFRIVELGPGRGTLMDDMLRVVRQFPSVRAKLDSVHLVETSPAMRALQRTTLSAHDRGTALSWHDALDQIPPRDDRFTMLIAHEFFDALPVHVIEKTAQGWHEVLIAPASDPGVRSTSSSPPRWTRVLSPAPTATSTLLGHASPRFATFPIGARVEVSRVAMSLGRQIAHAVAPGGCALVIDYGAEKAVGNSLRAFRKHDIVDVFHRPGECDVTTNVDFALLKEVMTDVTTHGTLPQGVFLNEVGIQVRAQRLIDAAATPERKTAIAEGVNRLVDPLGMGGQYAVLGVTGPKGDPVWPFLHKGLR